MLGCLLLGAAGLFLATRMFHRHHHGWHHGRWAHCGSGFHGPDGGGHGGWHGYGHGRMDGGYRPEGMAGDEGGGWDEGPRWLRGRFGRGFMARALAERLDATPAQEKVIREATDEVREAAAKLKGEGKRTRGDVAGAFRQGHFDAVLFGELFARHDRGLEDLRKAFVGMGARIHEVLDERQRQRLAELIEAGPGAWRQGWGARGWGRARA
jgi:hypothetical protein